MTKKILRIRKAICSGYFVNICQWLPQKNNYQILCHKQLAFIHPSSFPSTLAKPPSWIVYVEFQRTKKIILKWCQKLIQIGYLNLNLLQK